MDELARFFHQDTILEFFSVCSVRTRYGAEHVTLMCVMVL